jgi:hypothetical protein
MKLPTIMVLAFSMLGGMACSKSSDTPLRYGTTTDSQGNAVLTNASSPDDANTSNTAPRNPRTSRPAIGGGPVLERSEALDADDSALSSQKPGSKDADRALAVKIRQSLLADKSLSGLARSIEVATSGGTVTLRGVVSTLAEREIVGAKAIEAAGPSRVFNLVEVKSP